MFVRPSLHGKKGLVKFKLLFARYPTLNSGVKDTIELNWMAFEVGNSWNEVNIGYKGMEIESKATNRRIFALWQCSGSMRQMEAVDEDWRVFDRDKERNERQERARSREDELKEIKAKK